MHVDDAFQTIYTSFKKVKWTKFNDNLEWYYAESMLYVVHDTVRDMYSFVKSKSPEKACEHVISKQEM